MAGCQVQKSGPVARMWGEVPLRFSDVSREPLFLIINGSAVLRPPLSDEAAEGLGLGCIYFGGQGMAI
jgi:hypothetical protein